MPSPPVDRLLNRLSPRPLWKTAVATFAVYATLPIATFPLCADALTHSAPLASTSPFTWIVALDVEQHLYAQRVELLADQWRIVWAGKPFLIPFERVARIDREPAGALYLDEPFTQPQPWRDQEGWELSGEIELAPQRHVSPPHALRLQSGTIRYRPQPPVSAGELCLRYYDDGHLRPYPHWRIRAHFGSSIDQVSPPTIAIEPATDTFSLRVSPLPDSTATTTRIERKPGWHHLRLVFAADRVVVYVDGHVLLSDLRSGPGQPLSSLSIERVNQANPDASGSLPEVEKADSPEVEKDPANDTDFEFWIDDLLLFADAPNDVTTPRRGQQTQVRMWNHDQWFGKLAHLDGDWVAIQGEAPAMVRQSWGRVRQVVLPEPDASRPALDLDWNGTIGKVQLRDGTRLVVERIQAANAKSRYRHPLLGELEIPDEQVVAWTNYTQGRRRVFPQPRFVPAAAGAVDIASPLLWETTFTVDNEEDEIALTYYALRGEIGPTEKRIEAEIWLNQTRIAQPAGISPRGDPARDKWYRERVVLPRALLREGENRLAARLRTTEGAVAASGLPWGEWGLETGRQPGTGKASGTRKPVRTADPTGAGGTRP